MSLSVILAKIYPLTDPGQVLTSSIFIGWTSYVVSLSQAGKRSPLSALGDAVKGVGEGDLGLISGREGLGLVKSIAGGE